MYEAVDDVGKALGVALLLQNIVEVAQHRHLAVNVRVIRITERGVVVVNAFPCIGADQGIIQKLLFLIGHIGDQKGEEDMKPLNFGCQFRAFDAGAIQHFFYGLVYLAYLQHVDAAFGGGGDTDKLAACVDAGTVELMTFQGCQHENLYALTPHTECHQQDQEGLSCAASAAYGNIGVFIDLGVKDVDDDRRVVVLVQAEQDAVFITQFIGREGVAACHAGGQCVALGALIEVFLHADQRQRGEKRLLLMKGTTAHVHVAGHEQLLHLVDLPFQFVHCGRCHCNEEVQVIEVLVVSQPFFQKVSASDGTVQIIKVRVGIAGVLDLTAVDTELLAQPLHHAGFRLAADEHIQIDAIPGVDDKGQPAGRHLRLVAGGWHQQIGIVESINADMPPVGEVDAVRGKKLRTGDGVDLGLQPLFLVLGNDLPDTIRQRHGAVTAQQVIKRIDRKFIIIFRDQYLVAALLQVVYRSTGRRLQRGDGLLFLIAAFPACPRLIFKYHEVTACGGLPRADPVNERQIVLLQQAAVFIGLLCHLLLYDLPVPVQVGTLGNDLDLHFDRADLQERYERIDDVPLLSGAAQQKVDRYDLNDLQVAVIPCVDDAVFNLLHGQVLRHRIDILGSGVTALGLMFLPFLSLALFLFIACNNAAVMEVFQDKEDERGETFAVDAHQCDDARRQRGQA